jgi:hypothetical protein
VRRAGHGCRPLEQLLEQRQPARRRNAAALRVHCRDHDRPPIEPEIPVGERGERSDEQPRADEEEDADGDLQCDQQLARAGGALLAEASGPALQRVDRRGTAGKCGRRGAKEHECRDHEPGTHGEHTRVR